MSCNICGNWNLRLYQNEKHNRMVLECVDCKIYRLSMNYDKLNFHYLCYYLAWYRVFRLIEGDGA